MGASSIQERVQAIAEQVAIDHGLELVHAEVAGPENKGPDANEVRKAKELHARAIAG